MSAIGLFMYVVSTIGMCHIIVDGSILQWFRDGLKKFSTAIKFEKLGSVVDCYLCAGTWCGFFMGFIWLTHDPLQIFACGCAGGFLSNFAAVILNYLEAKTIVDFPDGMSHIEQAPQEENGQS
jgi:hypothetical protein